VIQSMSTVPAFIGADGDIASDGSDPGVAGVRATTVGAPDAIIGAAIDGVRGDAGDA
jgi:hypothetical protein